MNHGMIQVHTSHNGHPIPVYKETHLHSIIDPIEEASVEMGQFEQRILKSKNILILGLGFGYHIDECERILNRYNKKANICVLEPNRALIELCKEKRSSTLPHLFTSNDPISIFDNNDFIEYLLLSPLIIPHRASFKSNYSYYEKFLKHRATSKLEEGQLTTILKQSFPNSYKGKTIKEIEKIIYDKESVDTFDFSILALSNLQIHHREDHL